MFRSALLATGLAMLAACGGDSTPPQAFGSLDSRITRGERQSYTAGGETPENVIDLIFRNPITGAVIKQPSRWERLLLPKLAYALQIVGVKVQPNSVVCVREDQTVLIPAVRCVNSDAEGNTRFDFLNTTKAGKHKALIQATYGLETTVPDTVEITVLPDVADPNYRSSYSPYLCSPLELSAELLIDRFGNGVPYRVVSDGRVRVNGDTVGTVAARTIVFDSASTTQVTDSRGTTSVERDMEIRGEQGALLGYVRYNVIVDRGYTDYCGRQGKPAVGVIINYYSRGVSAPPQG